MTRLVEVNPDYYFVYLPGFNRQYSSGDQIVISDAIYDSLPEATLRALHVVSYLPNPVPEPPPTPPSPGTGTFRSDVTEDFIVSPSDTVWVRTVEGQTITGSLLPEPAGDHCRIKHTMDSAGTLILVPPEGMSIDGQPQWILHPGDAIELDSDGVQFVVF